MNDKKIYLGVDAGTKRIGLAQGDSVGRIAQSLGTLQMDDDIFQALQRIVGEINITDVVIGRPRSQDGKISPQTVLVEEFVLRTIKPLHLPVHWQDESVTSIIAEAHLKSRKKPYTKGDIDAEAASIILQDFLDRL